MLDSKPLLIETDFPVTKRVPLQTLQVNMGYLCNLSCSHCHVNAGPKRTELLSLENTELILQILEKYQLQCLDLTGGAPEMNPHFRSLVIGARKLGVQVIDRCNLSILQQPGYEDMAEFLAAQGVSVVASLPCYLEDNVNAQRGNGVFTDSIDALHKLNNLGYGLQPELTLDLAYNPTGAFLPPPQEALEADYKRELADRYGIRFNRLLTITNMPIARFGSMLQSKGLFADYMRLLKDNFSEANLTTLMCRSLISVDWQGGLYDCDFNQMLELPIASDRARWHLRDLLSDSAYTGIVNSDIAIGDHCYGCTAGQGSSCSGALISDI
tara:strand:+ start:2992 stop:3969 length:978 start_codon:yes stop_codon:yes gene_type:complete